MNLRKSLLQAKSERSNILTGGNVCKTRKNKDEQEKGVLLSFSALNRF